MATQAGRSDEGRDVPPNGDPLPAAEPPPAGFLIRRLREAAGLTQVQLARRIGADIKTLNCLECGRSALSNPMARKIATALGQQVSVLMRAQLDYENWPAHRKPHQTGPHPTTRKQPEGTDPGSVGTPS